MSTQLVDSNKPVFRRKLDYVGKYVLNKISVVPPKVTNTTK